MIVLVGESASGKSSIERYLVENYGYSLEQMAQEIKVANSQRGQGQARADIVIWKSKQETNQLHQLQQSLAQRQHLHIQSHRISFI